MSRSVYVEGMRGIAEQWPYLRYLGLGAWWAWIWLCYNSVGLFAYWPAGNLTGQVGLMYLYSTTAIGLASLAAAMLWRRTTALLARRGTVVGLALVASAGVLLLACSPYLGGDAAFAAGGVLTGLGTSVLSMKTGEVFGTLGRREVLTAGGVAVMFSSLVYFMGVGLPAAWQPIFIALCPLFSALFYIMPGDDPFPGQTPGPREPGRHAPGLRSFANLVVASVMIAATAGFGKGLAAASMSAGTFVESSAIVTFLVFAGAAVVVFIVNCGDVLHALRRVYAALILLGVVVALGFAFGLNLAYLAVGKELLWLVFTCLMAYMVFRFDFSPVRAFGLGQAAYYAASALFWGLGMRFAPMLTSDPSRLAVSVVMTVAIVAVFAFVFNDADLKFILTWHRSKDDAKQPDEPGAEAAQAEDARVPPEAAPAPDEPAAERTLAQTIAAIPERFGISGREAEIMELFASGRSANWIADELYISKNTVRSHLRSIYVKLDVHTRQELLDFLKTV